MLDVCLKTVYPELPGLEKENPRATQSTVPKKELLKMQVGQMLAGGGGGGDGATETTGDGEGFTGDGGANELGKEAAAVIKIFHLQKRFHDLIKNLLTSAIATSGGKVHSTSGNDRKENEFHHLED
jgi:hypothetical protein